MILPKLQFLDAREENNSPVLDSVWIPFSQLAGRLSELPLPHAPIWLPAGLAPDGLKEFLERGGRAARAAPAAFGRPEKGRLWHLHPFLERALEEPDFPRPLPSPHGWRGGSKPKTVLDLGCGAGREAAYLTARGFQVLAVDHLPDAIERATQMVIRYGEPARFQGIVADFDQWEPPEKVDLVLAFMAHPRHLFERAKAWLNPGGQLLGEAYLQAHRQQTGIPRDPARTVSGQEPGIQFVPSETAGRAYYRMSP